MVFIPFGRGRFIAGCVSESAALPQLLQGSALWSPTAMAPSLPSLPFIPSLSDQQEAVGLARLSLAHVSFLLEALLEARGAACGAP